jgi:hypothetical protein
MNWEVASMAAGSVVYLAAIWKIQSLVERRFGGGAGFAVWMIGSAGMLMALFVGLFSGHVEVPQ